MNLEAVFTDYLIPLTYVLVGIATFGALVFGLVMTVMANPKQLITTVGFLVVLGILFGIGFSMSSGADAAKELYINNNIGESLSQSIGGALILTAILLGIALVGMLVNWVKSLII